ncbi:hypothetical protein HYV58_00290 [Candidatus Peregrinibacteria bacterium]|nr:hypothetical protein [Candidatus Peregrinibacteria bacterium]
MSPGFENLRPAIEAADSVAEPEKTNVSAERVESLFKKIEADGKLKTDPAAKERYEKFVAEQREKFNKLREGNAQKLVESLHNAMRSTLEALQTFCKEEKLPIAINVEDEYRKITGGPAVQNESRETPLTPAEQKTILKFQERAGELFGELQQAKSAGEVQSALQNIFGQRGVLADYERSEPDSTIIPQVRALRMVYESFFTQVTLASRKMKAEHEEEESSKATEGFWSQMKVLNAVPTALNYYTDKKDRLTYAEAKAAVWKSRAEDLAEASRGADIVAEALLKNPELTLEALQKSGQKELTAMGIAEKEKAVETHRDIQVFFQSPEGRRLVAISHGELTDALEAKLAQEALRIEKGSTLGVSDTAWEKVGDVAHSLASLDMIMLTLATGGAGALGKLASNSSAAVRILSAATRTAEAAKSLRGVRAATKAVEAVKNTGVVKGAAELSGRTAALLHTTEGASWAVNAAKEFMAKSLSMSLTVAKFSAAAMAAESVVHGSGHFVLAGCFIIPGAVHGFAEAVGKKAMDVATRAGTEAASAELNNLTQAYLLYIRNTYTSEQLSAHLTQHLASQGMAMDAAQMASRAFVQDVYKGQTARQLEESIAVQMERGPIGRVSQYLKRTGDVRESVRQGFSKISEVKEELLQMLNQQSRERLKNVVETYNRLSEKCTNLGDLRGKMRESAHQYAESLLEQIKKLQHDFKHEFVEARHEALHHLLSHMGMVVEEAAKQTAI